VTNSRLANGRERHLTLCSMNRPQALVRVYSIRKQQVLTTKEHIPGSSFLTMSFEYMIGRLTGRFASFFLVQYNQNGEIINQMATKLPNGHKIFQMAI
jgi:hypothetical protein